MTTDSPTVEPTLDVVGARETHNSVVIAADVFGDLSRENTQLRAEVERLRAERDEAVREVVMYARAAGEAEGRLLGSEMASVVEGWRERAEAAEARAVRLEALVKDVADDDPESSDYLRNPSCHYCQQGYVQRAPDWTTVLLHTDDCLWLRARRALTEGGEHASQ